MLSLNLINLAATPWGCSLKYLITIIKPFYENIYKKNNFIKSIIPSQKNQNEKAPSYYSIIPFNRRVSDHQKE